MKKILIGILALIMCVSLCGCGKTASAVGAITDNNGNAHKFTPRDLCEIKENNTSEFQSLYKNAKIKIEYGEVIEVTSATKSFDDNPLLTDLWYEITIQGGWVLKFPETAHPEAASVKVGDLVTIGSTISTCSDEYVYLDNSYYSEKTGKWEDDTYLKIHDSNE